MNGPVVSLRSLVSPIVLIALPVLLLWRVVFLGEAFLPADLLKDLLPWGHIGVAATPWDPLMWDGIGQFYPWRLFAAMTERGGFLPLWNPHEFCGAPFAANSQSAIYYPFNVLFAVLPITAAFGVSTILHLVLTGIFFHRFARTALGLGRGPALVGAVTWQLCTWQVSWLELPTFLCVSAWMPACLLLVDRLAKRPTAGSAAALGTALGLMLLAGHLQICLYGFTLIAAFGAYRLLPAFLPQQQPPCPSRATGMAPNGDVGGTPALSGRATAAIPRGRLIAGIVASCGIGLLVGLAQLLPTVELSRVSHRSGGSPDWHGYQSYISYGAMPLFQLTTLVIPDFYGNPTDGDYWGFDSGYAENACYIGIVGLLLAVFGAVSTWRASSHTRFFTCAAVIALLMALGTPFNALFYFGIPGFAESGSPARILVAWSLCAAALAAIGTQRILERRPGSILPAAVAAIVAVILIPVGAFGHLMWFLWKMKESGITQNLTHETSLWRAPVAVLLAGGFGIVQYRLGKMSRNAVAGILVAVIGLDLLAAGIRYNRSTAPANVYPTTPSIVYLQQNAGTDRIIPANTNWSLSANHPPPAVLPPNAAMAYGLYDTQGYDSLFPGQYMTFVAKANDDGRSPAPDENGNIVFTRGRTNDAGRELSGLYSLVPRILQPPRDAPKIRRVMTDGDATLLRNGYAKPHFQLIPSGLPAQAEYPAPTRVDITVPQSGGGKAGVIVRDEWYPGWRATVDGRATPIVEAPYVFRTVAWDIPGANLPPAHVVMRFEPSTTFLGIYCLALGWAMALGLCAFAWSRRRRIIGDLGKQ